MAPTLTSSVHSANTAQARNDAASSTGRAVSSGRLNLNMGAVNTPRRRPEQLEQESTLLAVIACFVIGSLAIGGILGAGAMRLLGVR